MTCSLNTKSLIKGIILFIFLFNFSSCNKDDSNPSENAGGSKIAWTNENTIVCFGTSITYGYGAGWRKWPYDPSNSGDRDSSYPSYIQDRLKIKVVNMGAPGAKTKEGIRLADSAYIYKPSIILLEYSANDFLSGIKADSAEKNMNRIVEIFLKKGYYVAILSFVNPDMIDKTPSGHYLQSQKDLAGEYYDMLKRVAQKYNLFFVDYIYKNIWYNPRLFSDAIHPNGEGYRIMADNVFESMQGIFSASGMLK